MAPVTRSSFWSLLRNAYVLCFYLVLFSSPLDLHETFVFCISVSSTRGILWTCYILDIFLWMLNLIVSLLMIRQGHYYINQDLLVGGVCFL